MTPRNDQYRGSKSRAMAKERPEDKKFSCSCPSCLGKRPRGLPKVLPKRTYYGHKHRWKAQLVSVISSDISSPAIPVTVSGSRYCLKSVKSVYTDAITVQEELTMCRTEATALAKPQPSQLTQVSVLLCAPLKVLLAPCL